MPSGLPRRMFLVSGAVVFAGCVGGSSNGDEPSGTATPSPTPAPSPTPTRTQTPTPQPSHPYENHAPSVNIQDDSDADFDVESVATEALEYWVESASRYVGFDFDYEKSGRDSADLTIEYTDESRQCGKHVSEERILGCAPLLRDGDSGDRVSLWVVVDDRPRGRVVTTTKHELGHVLGLTHDDGPAEIMSTDPSDRIPLYEKRIEFWERFAELRADSIDARSAHNQALEYWNRERVDESEEKYNLARMRYSILLDELDEASSTLDTLIAEAGDDLASDSLEELYHSSVLETQYELEAVEYMLEAIDAYNSGSYRRHSTAIEKANEALDKSDRYRFATVNEIGVSLGLDEPIVD